MKPSGRIFSPRRNVAAAGGQKQLQTRKNSPPDTKSSGLNIIQIYSQTIQ